MLYLCRQAVAAVKLTVYIEIIILTISIIEHFVHKLPKKYTFIDYQKNNEFKVVKYWIVVKYWWHLDKNKKKMLWDQINGLKSLEEDSLLEMSTESMV